MEFTKGMRICHYYDCDEGYQATVIGVSDMKKLDGSNIKIVVYEYDSGNIGKDDSESLNKRFNRGGLKIGGCANCDVVKCEHHPKYVPPPPPDTEEKLKKDVMTYAEMLADCAITGDVYEDQVYKDIMGFLRRERDLTIKRYNEIYND